MVIAPDGKVIFRSTDNDSTQQVQGIFIGQSVVADSLIKNDNLGDSWASQ